jgi:hypothetical protein
LLLLHSRFEMPVVPLVTPEIVVVPLGTLEVVVVGKFVVMVTVAA